MTQIEEDKEEEITKPKSHVATGRKRGRKPSSA